MGRTAKDAKQMLELSNQFEPLELNEAEVRAIFNRCRKPNGDGSTGWNGETLKQNKAGIRFLLGQLALVHEGVKEHELDSTFMKSYDGKSWTNDSSLLIDFLNLGIESGFCSFYKRDGKQFIELRLSELKSTLSPKDTKFTAWWEGADGLMIQAQAAKDENKQAEALSFYERAADLGDDRAKSAYVDLYYEEAPANIKPEKVARYRKDSIKGLRPGDELYLGHYYFKGDGEEKEKIVWQVLAKEKNRILIISKGVLDCKPYHNTEKEVTWESCDLRKWLNDGFYNMVFDTDEKKMIMFSALKNPDNVDYDTKGGRDTKDHVFLLSIEEALCYFAEEGEKPQRGDKVADIIQKMAAISAMIGEERKQPQVGGKNAYYYAFKGVKAVCWPSPYAKEQGMKTNEKTGTGKWLLRSPGAGLKNASQVTHDGDVDVVGNRVNNHEVGVRPALWLELES